MLKNTCDNEFLVFQNLDSDHFPIPIRYVSGTQGAQDNLWQFDIFSASRPDF